MSSQVRSACLLLVLFAIVLAQQAGRPGPFLGFASAPDPFPAQVVAPPSPVPLVHTERPDLRVAQLVTSMEAMWAALFAAGGDEYERATIDTSPGEVDVDCGRQMTGWAGIYCPRNGRIVIDLGDHSVVRAAAGDERADDMLGYVLAHEIGHHVQTLRGAPAGDGAATTLRRELHAECLAGVWGRAAGRAAPPPWTYSSDAAHGTAQQQRTWLETGHRTGSPAACDAVWEDGAGGGR